MCDVDERKDQQAVSKDACPHWAGENLPERSKMLKK
jgi:hypothetical protein